MPKRTNLYIGRAGQMAVMAEFLIRGYNVAVPEVDIGDDIFVVKDNTGEYSRIQVKTAIAVATAKGYSAKYQIKLTQIEKLSQPETWFVLANRVGIRWQSFLVISRKELNGIRTRHQIGSVNQEGSLILHITYMGDVAICSKQDLSPYLNNWQDWPSLSHEE